MAREEEEVGEEGLSNKKAFCVLKATTFLEH